MTEERSPGLRVIYFDGTEGYLVPHATRTTLNSLAFQKKLFGFDPKEDVTVLLLDLSDSGNAGASSVPNNLVSVQIAPLGFSFETLAANERLNTIMNHELVHVATMDQAAGSDRMFRSLFGGKVLPIKEQPESILYFYLTSPRVAAPRWFHEGIAVFVDTWMAGGLGRVQSGYDEMVFRAMVRDNATFYNPLGLVSKGTDADFQLEINSYLYGSRFMTWLARRYSPEQLIEWAARREGSRAYYAAQFRKVFGVSLEEAWAQWIADERTFQQANLAAIRKFPVTPYRDVTSRALGSVSRAYFDPASRKIYAAFNYPGVVAHVGAIDIDTGAVQRIVPIKGPVIYTVTSLAWDPDARALFYTTDNGSYRDLMQLDPGDRQDPHAAERRAHRRHRLQQGRQGVVGHPSSQWLRHDRAHPGPVHLVGTDGDAAVRDDRLRSRRLARWHEARGVVWRDHRSAGRARAERRGVEEARCHAAGEI